MNKLFLSFVFAVTLGLSVFAGAVIPGQDLGSKKDSTGMRDFCSIPLDPFGVMNGGGNYINLLCRPISDDFCKKHKPIGACDPNIPGEKTTCTQFAGGACIYFCKLDKTYDDGAVCTSGKCTPNGLSCQI